MDSVVAGICERSGSYNDKRFRLPCDAFGELCEGFRCLIDSGVAEFDFDTYPVPSRVSST